MLYLLDDWLADAVLNAYQLRSSSTTVCKDPGPEGPALVHPGGVMKVATFTNRVQVSGVRCQQLKSTR